MMKMSFVATSDADDVAVFEAAVFDAAVAENAAVDSMKFAAAVHVVVVGAAKAGTVSAAATPPLAPLSDQPHTAPFPGRKGTDPP